MTAGGESGDPRSPHFNDQAERYATGDLRDVYFYPAQLEGHTEREYHPGRVTVRADRHYAVEPPALAAPLRIVVGRRPVIFALKRQELVNRLDGARIRAAHAHGAPRGSDSTV